MPFRVEREHDVVVVDRSDLEHLLDFHNKQCGDAQDSEMFERLTQVLHPEPDEQGG